MLNSFEKLKPTIVIIFTACLCFFQASSVVADSYGVQIGAFKKYATVTKEKLIDIVETYAYPKNNLSIIIAGKYETAGEAQQLIPLLKQQGFTDAFVTKHPENKDVAIKKEVKHIPGHGVSIDEKNNDIQLNNHQEAIQAVTSASNTITVDNFRSIVELDGKLHRKEGDKFIPLTQDEVLQFNTITHDHAHAEGHDHHH